jgi:hypothetical protein
VQKPSASLLSSTSAGRLLTTAGYIGLAALLIEGKPNSPDFYSLLWDYETLPNKQRPAIAKFLAESD